MEIRDLHPGAVWGGHIFALRALHGVRQSTEVKRKIEVDSCRQRWGSRGEQNFPSCSQNTYSPSVCMSNVKKLLNLVKE